VELGRYAITHGKTTLAAFDTLPGPKLGTSWICWLWLIMMLTTQAQIAAMEGTVGQAAHMAFPRASQAMANAADAVVPAWGSFLATREEYVWAGITTVAAILLLLSGGYRRLEKITTVLVAAVTLFTVVSVVILQWMQFRIRLPDLREGLTFRFPAAALALAFSAFGITESAPRNWSLIRTGASKRALRAARDRGPPTMAGPGGHEAGSGSCNSTPGSAWSCSRWPRCRST